MSWDVLLLMWLNHLVATSEQIFTISLFLSDRFPWVLTTLAMVMLWFTTDRWGKNMEQIGDEPVWFAGRRQVILILLSAMLAFIISRPIAHFTARPRPLAEVTLETPIDPSVWNIILDLLKTDGAFPSDHAAFWGALTAGIFLINRPSGVLTGLFSLFFSLLRIGIGYHYPSDMIVGFILGIWVFVGIYAVRKKLTWLINLVLQFFDAVPVVAYPLGFLIMYDVTQRMAWLFGFLANFFGILVIH